MSINVIELFAGVGGFRLGLERSESDYKIVWSNQWEPSTKVQHASMVYENNWGKVGHSNVDINSVNTDDIPSHDLLCGGFPCQDYSVASTTKNSKGLIGKKGVLWWSIHKILSEVKSPTKYLLLENVDRLLISPSNKRGRDFAIILKSLSDLGYCVEWRVINSAEYGMPQRRKRVYILAYHKTTSIYQQIQDVSKTGWLTTSGVMSKSLPVDEKISDERQFDLVGDLVELSNDFNPDNKFENTGIMLEGKVYTIKTKSKYVGRCMTIGDIMEKGKVADEFYIDETSLEAWKYLKGPKKKLRTNSEGFQYHYSEGGMTFPDPIDKPSRTIITGEGGKSASRFKHVIQTDEGLRRLTPIELERLCMFPDDHTKFKGITDTKRAFFMGNALVVGIVEKIGKTLSDYIYKYEIHHNGKSVSPNK